MTTIQIKHKLKQGHKMFTDKEVRFLLERIAELEKQVNQPALPLDAPAPGAEAEATG